MTQTPSHEAPTPATNAKPLPARRSRRLTAIMAVVAVLGVAWVVHLKRKSDQIEAEKVAAQVAAAQQRAASEAEIMEAIARAYRGESNDAKQLALVARVGAAIANSSEVRAQRVSLRFHLLSEPNAINLFAFSSGDIYLTTALLNRMQTEGQLAAVLAHGAAHVLAGDTIAPVAVVAGAQPNWHHRAEEEPLADPRAAKIMAQAGYDPSAMIGMFVVLLKAYQAGADVAFFTTHPNAEGRLKQLYAAITTLYPNGIPKVLSK